MVTCIIIEDQPPAQRVLQKYISDLGTLNLKATFSDALEAIKFLQKEQVDLIFLDIHLPKLSGLNFIKTLSYEPDIILTTAFSDYALESYEYDVTDYLLKPFSFERFVKAVSKVESREISINRETLESKQGQETKKRDIYIKSGHDFVRLDLDDVLFIRSDADFTEIWVDNKKYLSYESLKYWIENLPSDQFYRVHKSYIVNSCNVAKITGNQIILGNDQSIPIGRAYKEDFLNKIL